MAFKNLALHDQRVAVPIVYIAAMFMSVLDTTIVTVALPTIGHELGGGSSALALVSIAYLVALGVFIPVSGWLGDLLGGRRALLAAVAVFTAASLLCGLATSLPELIAFRFLQGIGGAVMTPVGLAMLFRVYPPAERVRISSIVTVFVTLGPALGPVLGGVFTTYVTWRLAFVVNVPVGIAALVVGAFFLERHEQPSPGRLDVPGVLLSAVGLSALLYGISSGSDEGWASPAVLTTLLVGVVLLVLLVVVEHRTTRPLIDLSLFRNRLFTAATSLYGLGSISFIGVLFLAALFFQNALGLSAVQSGLTSFPSAIGTMLGAQLVTRWLYRRIGPRRIVAGGLVIIAVATGLLALVTRGTDLWLVRLIMFGLGAGVSAVFVPSQASAMATVDKARTGRASALFNAGKQVGSAVGVALLGTILGAVGAGGGGARDGSASLGGYHAGFLAAAVVALLAVGVALTIRDADAAGTMAPGPVRSERASTSHRWRGLHRGQLRPSHPGDPTRGAGHGAGRSDVRGQRNESRTGS